MDEEIDPLLHEEKINTPEDSPFNDRKRLKSPDSPLKSIQNAKSIFMKWRNFTAFWLVGCCTNMPFFIMLNSAYDILDNLATTRTQSEPNYESYNSLCVLYYIDSINDTDYTPRKCLAHGTYEILLANILPMLVVKATVPYFMHHIPYWIRVITTVIFSIASLLLVAMGTTLITVLTGVIFTSISSGIGEVTFLALTTRYENYGITITGWSSGTGASGLLAGLIYTGLTNFMSPRNSILIILAVPFILFLSYVFILTKAEDANSKPQVKQHPNATETPHEGGMLQSVKLRLTSAFQSTFNLSRFRLLLYLFSRYMIWLIIVYVAEYSINQSLFESLYYPNTAIGGYCLSQSVQYKWYQVTYQIGVFVSRSSIALFHIKYFHPLSFLQVINFILLFMEVIFQVVPSFWIVLVVVLYEGVLGGALYVNAFYSISAKTESSQREFAMGVVSVADSVGISVAGLLSYFIHSYVCSLGY